MSARSKAGEAKKDSVLRLKLEQKSYRKHSSIALGMDRQKRKSFHMVMKGEHNDVFTCDF